MNTPPPQDTLPTLTPDGEPPAIDYYSQLKPRHQRVIDGLVAGMSQTQAYVDAGFSPNGANTSASQLLANPLMQAALEQKRCILARSAALTREQYVADLKAIVDADGAAMVDSESFLPTNPHMWPLALRQLISGIEMSERETEDGRSRTLKVRLSDRLKARELLGKAAGFFAEESRGSQFALIINLGAEPGQAGPRPVAEELPLAPGVTLRLPPA